MSRGKKIGLGEFLGDAARVYNPDAALPTGPRLYDESEDDRRGGRGGFGDRRGGDRFERDREPSRSDQSDQWRGDRSGDRGGDRFGGGGGGSRFDRPSRDNFVAEERPSHMRLNLQRRSDGPARDDVRTGGGGGGGDKWSSAFGGGGGGLRRGGGDDRFGRGGDARFDDRGGSRGGGLSSAFGNMRMNEDVRFSGGSGASSSAASVQPEVSDKKARAQKLREERKKKAEEERLAAEEAKRVAAEAAKAAAEAEAVQVEKDRAIITKVLANGAVGEELATAAKTVFAAEGTPLPAVVIEAVTKQAESVAKVSANWIAPQQYGELLKLVLPEAEVKAQVKALYALQVFLNQHDFPKGVMEKCFMALYTLDMVEEAAFLEYKYDVDNDAPGRMKAIVQTSNWLTWLETPEEESDEEEDE